MKQNKRVLLLAGGVGGAKMAEGLQHSSARDDFAILGNIADDQELHGLWVSPDIDTVTYTLTDRIDRDKGWGLKNESNRTLDALSALGEDTWMYLGDQDFATHIYRTAQRNKGVRPSEIAQDIAGKLGLSVPLLLPTDDVVQTKLNTDLGWLDFQSYFVRYQCSPEIKHIVFEGADKATATPEALAAIAEADVIIFAPSNPIVSIGAILSVPEIAQAVKQSAAYKIAVSPLIGGKTVKGPADEMLRASGIRCDALGVAQHYRELIDTIVIDHKDNQLQAPIEALGVEAHCTETLMQSRIDKIALAEYLLSCVPLQRQREAC
ncbi:MAG: 2-phospho-L-lactate transferase [Pseudomonadales bacterium]